MTFRRLSIPAVNGCNQAITLTDICGATRGKSEIRSFVCNLAGGREHFAVFIHQPPSRLTPFSTRL